MSGVKRAHMVPKSYLRAWADDRNRVEVLDLEKGRGFKTSIQNATVVSYAYDPRVLTRDLEQEFSRIEGSGVRAIVKLRNGHQLSASEKRDMVAFLDMHLDRGRYADQTEILTPAVLVKTDGTNEQASLNLGDRLLLSRHMDGPIRLASLGVDQWTFEVVEAKHLATGDGAVLLFRETNGAPVSTATFPLSPTQVLVIGAPLEAIVPLNTRLAMNSRRWIVGSVGTLRLGQAATISKFRDATAEGDSGAT